jgi:hypothetical protein
METARPKTPPSPAQGRSETNSSIYRRIAPEDDVPDMPVGDLVARAIARALAEELASDGRFIGRLAEAIVDRMSRHEGAEFTEADLKDATDDTPPRPLVLPGVVPIDVVPEPAPVVEAGTGTAVSEAPRGRPDRKALRGSAAYRARKAWTQKNYYRRLKGLPLLPRPDSWDAPKKKDEAETPPKPEDG